MTVFRFKDGGILGIIKLLDLGRKRGIFGGEFSYYIVLGSNLSRINVTKGIIGIPWLLGAVLVLGC